jgi:ATP-dependent protease ClpP protease subunit
MVVLNNTINSNDHMLLLHEYGLLPEKREVFLHSYIEGETDSGVDYRSSVIFQKNIRYLTLNNNNPILIHMNIPGGDWEDCLSIFDTIRLCAAKTIIIGYGKVQSSSGVIFQAPTTRLLMPNASLLIHYGSISFDDEHSKAAASNVQWSEKETDKMVNIFVQRCLKSPIAKEKKWKNSSHIVKKHIMSQISTKCDWILDAEEAVYYGFADGIVGSKKYPNIESIKSQCCSNT